MQVEIHKAKTGAALDADLLATLRAYTVKMRYNRPPNDIEQEEPPSDLTPANVTCHRCDIGVHPTVQHLARLACSRTSRSRPLLRRGLGHPTDWSAPHMKPV
ncbi:hypothetical protein IscW_ISCW009557 [Ixodes scapularis]|uniref:Uncharacterized protein n=1 Tax=Ixodes scapularis TaxID=6945 RepID=B7Q2F0_IXOSC|nr:hypothetical protein IscW_ISCW009557 [Ixodes scapularis]|eukprot:XP_002410747.1 hypothetical protein IscW_ISCW009557 [Ixodes scapularis]